MINPELITAILSYLVENHDFPPLHKYDYDWIQGYGSLPGNPNDCIITHFSNNQYDTILSIAYYDEFVDVGLFDNTLAILDHKGPERKIIQEFIIHYSDKTFFEQLKNFIEQHNLKNLVPVGISRTESYKCHAANSKNSV